jgi:hypothetical protein
VASASKSLFLVLLLWRERSDNEKKIVEISTAIIAAIALRVHGEHQRSQEAVYHHKAHTFSAFWLRSSVVSVLISLISDTLGNA